MHDILGTITQYSIPGQEKEIDVTEQARRIIEEARNSYETAGDGEKEASGETKAAEIVLAAQTLMMAGKYSELIARVSDYDYQDEPELADVIAWAFLMHGNELSDQAAQTDDEAADQLFSAAGEKYAAALAIKSDFSGALNNWGLALSGRAKMKAGAEAGRLFSAAGKKYEAALKIKPDRHEALYNWGKRAFRPGQNEGRRSSRPSIFGSG